MGNSFFITGTDTNVGKTLASCALMQAAKLRRHLNVAGFKPVASGARFNEHYQRFENSDALALLAHSNIALNYAEVNPYCFEQATAPHIISERYHQPISQALLDQQLSNLQDKADVVVIEGAGGWFTPLSKQSLFSDWVIKHQLPVILVVGMKLGCINHALLSHFAIKQAHLTLHGWIANCCVPQDEFYQPYLQTLKNLINAPMLGEIPFLANTKQCQLSGYIHPNWQTI